ncbi:MAG: NADH-quinone oxidoreductase subunit NuoF [Candidatus Izemoplasmatales bacterium]|jgi:NADH:ubiquinone oxidoreductase subunit F (NADH-binding)/(2Fe-2S) ferredoxin/NAD-dependent dihydropyrimidine dehydrogenase PreA subunit|nr:NADH-quinone oxidoreductase subunit NuoF [Candidatus Izemoplasmatales bacterium]
MLERMHILICGGTGCLSSHSKEIKEEFDLLLKEYEMSDEVKLVMTGCFGLCEKGPVVVVYPDEVFYSHVKVEDVSDIVKEHVVKGRPVERLMVKDPIDKKKVKNFSELKFYSKQKRIALRNCGNINPLDINEYIAKDGYLALGKVLAEFSPLEVIDYMKRSGLRGRGGGGFPTGLKWEFASKSVDDQKYVICNADEGDPGAFMDRAVLEGDPHSVLEAMAICGYAIGSNQGYIYVRAEYPVAVERLNIAIKQAREYQLLGNNILGSNFSFDIELRLGAGAFVCGEETALIASIEGYRGMPRNKPPFPAVKGLWGHPTNVNNVETFANVPVVFLKSPEWFKSIGTEKSSGTKVFALGGKIQNTGLLEVPMGTTLREVIFDIGGGIPNKRKFKSVQTGGPSGGCITEESLDTPIDFDNLINLGSMMGSGGMIVMDEDNCMVDVAKFYLDFTVDESCGKCTPCREGTRRMLDILNKICEGEGSLEDLDTLESLGNMIKDTSLCGLGQTAPNPVLSTLKHFRDEYIAHVVDKVCPAGVCANLTNYVVMDNCIGCTKCAKNCPVDAITGSVKTKHFIDLDKCIRCGACKKACPVNAITSKPEGWEERING